MLFKQFVDDDLGCATYLIGDEEEGTAVVVDPPFAIEPVVEEAERRHVELVGVLETHTHADHLSGHGRLALEHGLPVSIHERADAEYPHSPLADGDVLDLGCLRITVVHTPGHRPEHCAFAVADRTRAEEPWLVLSGDSLFVGDAGRPDLAVEPREGAEGLYRSLRRLLELPDGVELYPGHVAGSLCGSAMSSKASSTIGFERRFNPLLLIDDEDEFVSASTGSAGVRPPNVERIVGLNRGRFVGAPQPLAPIDSASDGVVLDVRPAEVFAAGHVPGALNIPLEAGFGTRAGFVLDPGEPVVLHASTPEEAELATRGLNAVAFLDLDGYLDGPATPAQLDPIGLAELEELLDEGEVEVLDVREAAERARGFIPGSRHVPYRLLRACAGDLGADLPVVTICESGSRAAVAASILAAAGVEVRPVLVGGMAAWNARGNQTVHFRRCGA